MTHFIIAAILSLFTLQVSAQSCIPIRNAETGQVLSVQCLDQYNRLIDNGQVFFGGQNIILRNGQMIGCASRVAVQIQGRNFALGYSSCLQAIENSGQLGASSQGEQRVRVATPDEMQNLGGNVRQVQQIQRYCSDEEACPEGGRPWKEVGAPPYCAIFQGSLYIGSKPMEQKCK